MKPPLSAQGGPWLGATQLPAHVPATDGSISQVTTIAGFMTEGSRFILVNMNLLV